MNKEILRSKIILERMEFFNSESFADSCRKVCKNINMVLSSIAFAKRKLIGFYYPVKGEVDLSPLYNEVEKFAFPRLIFIKSKSEIEYAEVNTPDELFQSKLSFKEPSKNAEICYPEIIFVPGVCFDTEKNRLGYGKGHFDKFIFKSKKSGYYPTLIGTCFDFQLFDKVPTENHDQKLDMIITETKII